MTVNQMFSKLVDALYPPNCVLCGEPGQHQHDSNPGVDLCGACQIDLTGNSSSCFQCGIPLPVATNHAAARCGDCLKSAPAFQHTCVPYLYQWPLDRLIQVFKFQGNLAVGRVLSALLSQAIQIDSTDMPVAIIPIPLHSSRLQERGFNQAALLATDLASSLQIPLCDNLLLRQKSSQPQAELDAGSRAKNIKGVFEINPSQPIPTSVALVDDVMTTGSTLAEAAQILINAGVSRVDCWVVARTP